MVVRFNGSRDAKGGSFDWMTEEQRRTEALPSVGEQTKTIERREQKEAVLQKIGEVYAEASFAQGFERVVLLAEANDKLLRVFLESGERNADVVRGIEKVRDVMSTIITAQREREKFMKSEGALSEEDRGFIAARILEDTPKLEESIKGMLGFIDVIRAKLPEAVLFTNHVFDAFYGVDLLRIKGFQWNEESQTLEIDVIAYQAKSANSTQQMRVDTVKKYKEKFEAFQKVAQVDVGQLGELGHRPDVDLSQRSTEELLKIAQGSGTSGLTDLEKFARRLRDIQNANTLAQATGKSGQLPIPAPAARIRSVSGRFLGKNERGEPVNESFENILKAPLPPPPSQQYLDKKRRMSGFFRNND